MISSRLSTVFTALKVTCNVNTLFWKRNGVLMSGYGLLPIQLIALKKNKFIVHFLSLICCFWSRFFSWTLFPVFFFQLLIYSAKYLKFRIQNKQMEKNSLSGTVFLNAHGKAFQVYKSSGRNENFTILNLPYKQFAVNAAFSDYQVISIFDLLTFKDICSAFFLQCKLLFLVKQAKMGGWLSLQGFLLFLTQKSLINYPGLKKIIFCNADRLSYICTYLSPDIDCIFMQHGLLNENLSPQYFSHSWGKIATGFFYNTDQAAIANKFISKISEVKFFVPSLKLTPLQHAAEGKSILLIGCDWLYGDIELDIIKKYSNQPNVYLYVKPHPNYPSSFYKKLLKTYEFTLIEQRELFPDVDEIISYESTLAYEYMLWNKKVHIHSNL